MNTETSNEAKASAEQKIREHMVMLEAALYVAGRPLDLNMLGRVINTRSKKKIQYLVKKLAEEYQSRHMSLEVLELENERYVLQLKHQFSSKVRRLAIRPLLTNGPLKTLSYIAYRQPISQKQVTDVRGRHVYGHIRQLIDMGLVETEKTGRAHLLRTTDYFSDFFGLSQNYQKMKRQLKRIFRSAPSEESLATDEEDEAQK